MNGPQHYAKAEVLLSNAWDHVGKDGPLLHSAEVRLALVTAAQAHATLALAAATALAGLGAIETNTTEFYDADDETAVKWLKAMGAES